MTTFLPLVTLLLILAMMCFLLYYFYIQQSLETLSRQLASMQPPQASARVVHDDCSPSSVLNLD